MFQTINFEQSKLKSHEIKYLFLNDNIDIQNIA